jgi:hypothetical protein
MCGCGEREILRIVITITIFSQSIPAPLQVNLLSWDTSTTAISATLPAAVQPSGEQCRCSGGVYPQDAAGDSGLGAALAASRSGVRTGRPPLRSGLHVRDEKEKVLKFMELTCLYVSKSPRCDMADVGCGCGVSLGHLALW